MKGSQDFDGNLRSWLQRAAPREAPDRVLVGALERIADEPQRRGWLASFSGGTRRRVILRGAAVTAVIGLAILAGMRLANLGPAVGGSPSPVPSGSASAEASVPPSGSAAVICDAFADGGPMDNIAGGMPHGSNDIQLGLLGESVDGLSALAGRASGDGREDLLAMANAVEDLTAAFRKIAAYSPEEFRALPRDIQDALQNDAQEAMNALIDAWPAFYLKYTERCAVPLDAPTVDCGPLDQVTCALRAAETIAGYRQNWEDGMYDVGLPPGLPVLEIVFGGSVDCISHLEIYWPGGGMAADSMCGDANPLPTPTAIVGSPEVGVPYQVIVRCTVDFPLGDTWWRFENAGPTPEPVFADLRGSVPAIVTLTSPTTAILHYAEGYERMLFRVEEPIETSCVGV
jgi:hypothetical protein